MACLISATFSSGLLANTSAVAELIYDGHQQIEELNLYTEMTRTERRTVRVPSTCYRTEYRRVCSYRPPQCRTVCDRNGNCHNRCSSGGTVCHQRPTQVPYGCMRTVTRSYEVHDYDVETKVTFEFNLNDSSETVQEKFQVRMNGERATLNVFGSKNYFLVLDKKSRRENREHGVKYINLNYKVRLVPATDVKSVFANGIQNVYLKDSILTFNLGAGFNFEDFTQQIRIYRSRRFRTDPLLLTKLLSNNEMIVKQTNNSSMVTIDLRNLGISLPNRMRVVLDTKSKINMSNVLNKNDVRTSASTNWLFK